MERLLSHSDQGYLQRHGEFSLERATLEDHYGDETSTLNVLRWMRCFQPLYRAISVPFSKYIVM